jgi:hypothetical protein
MEDARDRSLIKNTLFHFRIQPMASKKPHGERDDRMQGPLPNFVRASGHS